MHKKRFRLPLFWKILGWFWLSLVLIITLNLFVGFFYSNKIHFEQLPPESQRDFGGMMKKAELFIDRVPLKRVSKRKLRHFFFVDKSGKEIFGRPLPPILEELHSRVIKQKTPLVGWRKNEAFWGGHYVVKDGTELWVYSRQRPPRLSRFMVGRFFKDFARSLLITIFLISFPLSFFLSWLITSPIRKLQQASYNFKHDLRDRSDIKPLLKRRDEFGDLASDFDDLAKYLGQRIEAQNQLISDVSHELRSPLTRLKISLGLVEKQLKSSGVDVSRLQLEADRMNDMLERLLALSKLENAQFDYQKERFDLSNLFDSVIQESQFEADQKDITIDSRIEEGMMFEGEQNSLYSGIENILRNAIKYAPESSSIQCVLLKESNQYKLSISDNGAGVPDVSLSRIFEPFYRPQEDRARNSGGVGLGLSITKRAVELNGGAVTAENMKPHGLKITISLPT